MLKIVIIYLFVFFLTQVKAVAPDCRETLVELAVFFFSKACSKCLFFLPCLIFQSSDVCTTNKSRMGLTWLMLKYTIKKKSCKHVAQQ